VSGHGRKSSIALSLLFAGGAAAARAAEPPACLSTDATQWPAVHKPYVLVIASSSASMTAAAGAIDSCGYGTTRRHHLSCALRHAFETYSGTVHFGLATFARQQGSTCIGYSNFPGNADGAGCGPEPGALPDSSTRQGANIVVPIEADEVNQAMQTSNANALFQWVNNVCDGGAEMFADGTTGLNGPLRDAYRYFSNQWTRPDGTVTFTTPLGANDLTCRRLRVVLITAADENCDTQANAVDAASDLFAGFTLGTRLFRVTTSVIAFPAATQANMDAIAAAGGTGAAIIATNEAQISAALTNIVNGLVSTETCDGLDNDCNGCSDEGFRHYGSVGQTCCAWASPAQRTNCLNNYRASISLADPDGNPALLPCTTAGQAQDPTTWLCYDSREICDNADNNLDGAVDEGMVKCGNPLHCPQVEACNGADDDCDGTIDNGCPGGPVQGGPEICDGCDNDGDGIVDNGAMPVPCGLSSPGNCAGVATCKPAQPAPFPGGCVATGGFNACSFAPLAEVCDGIDNNCNGVVDDGIAGAACEPPGTPAGLRYGGNSQCQMGVQYCNQACLGFVGPTPEVTDLIDNDCDGVAEDGLDVIFKDGFE
jgi:hypothetical protein